MTNWCSNEIRITGDKSVIKILFDVVRSDAMDWGKSLSPSIENNEENRKRLCLDFDFNKVVPYPAEFAKMDAEEANSGYQAGGYEWCIKNWGTKWKAQNTSTIMLEDGAIHRSSIKSVGWDDSPADAIIEYNTAWGPSLPVTKALSNLFPDLTFRHAYKEEDDELFCSQIWKAGELLSDEKEEDFEEEEEPSLEAPPMDGVDSSNIYNKSIWTTVERKDGTLTIVGYRGKDSLLVIPEGATEIFENTFDYSNLTSVVIPTSVKLVGSFAFSGCWELSSVQFSEGLNTIGFGAFLGCSSLTSILIPKSVELIKDLAFGNCSGLNSVVISQGLKEISRYPFHHCSNLTSIVIPKSVTVMGEGVFEDCPNLVIHASKGSYAIEYAKTQGIRYIED